MQDRDPVIGNRARMRATPFRSASRNPDETIMSETAASLRHKIASAGELESVVRTMKAMAASNIGQYENAVRSLGDYYRTVQLGLAALSATGAACPPAGHRTHRKPMRSVRSYLAPIRGWSANSTR